jgi:hypothetical protein
MSALIAIASVLAACAVGIPLSIWATAGIRKNKRAFAIASALFFSFGLFNPHEEKIAEAREDTEHSKRQKSGDPPTPT